MSQLSLAGLVSGSCVPSHQDTPACTPGEPLPQLHHKTRDHSAAGFSAMNRMRINSQLCDVKLRSGMTIVSAHKVVLAAVSPYFHAMFNGEL